ncbi:MAG: 30S ribosomal protein S2, partial [Chitinophagales bacterium]
HIAIKEAKKLGIRTFGMVDTNSNPSLVDFAIPANDDASKSIEIITQYLADAIKEGLSDRQNMQDEEDDFEDETVEELVDGDSEEDSEEEEA